MQNFASKWNWKRHPFIAGVILLFIIAMIATLTGSESAATADSSACDAFFVGAAIEQKDSDRAYTHIVVHAISKEKGLITYKWEGLDHTSAGDTYYHPEYITMTCSKLAQSFRITD